jgi:hypothetical protein
MTEEKRMSDYIFTGTRCGDRYVLLLVQTRNAYRATLYFCDPNTGAIVESFQRDYAGDCGMRPSAMRRDFLAYVRP